MRKLSIFLAFILVVTFGQASLFAQCDITVDNVSNTWNGGAYLHPGMIHHAQLRVNASCLPTYDGGTPSRYNTTNTMLVYSPGDLATWNYTTGSLLPAWETLGWTQTVYIHFHKVSGSGTFDFLGYTGPVPNPDPNGDDSVAITFGGSTTWGGLTNEYNEVSWDIEFQSNAGDTSTTTDQKFICVDSVSQGLAGGSAWKWSPLTDPAGDVFPVWQGPYCYELIKQPNDPAELVNPETAYTMGQCSMGSIDFTADDTEQDTPYTWVLTGPGTLVSTGDKTATWSWGGETVPQCSDNTVITVQACDSKGGCGTAGTVNITVENDAPVFSPDGPIGPIAISTGTTKAQYFSASDGCLDPLVFSILDDGGIDGLSVVDADADSIWYTPVLADVGAVTMKVLVTDEVDQGCGLADTLEVLWVVSEGAPNRIKIEKDEGPDGVGAYQGLLAEVEVVLEAVDAVGMIGGFDFLFAYDASALSFQGATRGELIDEAGCNWEYFTYRFGPDGNCNGGCPSGLARVVGLAELNNGPYHPDCIGLDSPGVLFNLIFLVSNDRTFECTYAPVRFFWIDCGDNSLSNFDGSVQIVSSQVWDYVGAGGYIVEDYIRIDSQLVPYPTYLGYQPVEACDGGKTDPEENVDLFNGGVDIACANLIDDRGDINLNGIAYEIADAVMFTNYFIQGETAFGPIGSQQVQASIAASDANADGIPLSVADLVYLIRVVIGDAHAYPKVNPTHATFSHENGTMSVNSEMGAAYIVVEGKATPRLLAGNMEMKYGVVDNDTRILVYNSTQRGESFTGSFLEVEGEIVSIEFATYEGQPVEASNVPRTFSVEQNYPNPFNAETRISFAMPNAGEWRVSIYNVTGQLVEEFSGVAEVGGKQDVYWNAAGRSSGIYFYKVVAGDQTETKKAVYLK